MCFLSFWDCANVAGALGLWLTTAFFALAELSVVFVELTTIGAGVDLGVKIDLLSLTGAVLILN
jgi:hypothetical protein